jgi:hypothetical protein
MCQGFFPLDFHSTNMLMYANEMREGYSDNHEKEGRDGFITIDELLIVSEYLYKGLINLSNQRHPLAIYKGVKNMETSNEHEMLKASSRTYFFDIETTKDGKPYLKISESRINKETQEQTRNTLIIFEEDLLQFTGTFNAMSKRIIN